MTNVRREGHVTDDESTWIDLIKWGPCPGWCPSDPDPAVDMSAGGHMTDVREDGTAIRFHTRRWSLPDGDSPEAVQAVELEIVETCTKAGKPQMGEAQFLVNSDEGQYMSLTAAAVASGIIRQALADMAIR